MLHMFAFAIVSLLFLGVASGLSVMLYMAQDKIAAALRTGTITPASGPVPTSRVRLVSTTRTSRITPSLRAAA